MRLLDRKARAQVATDLAAQSELTEDEAALMVDDVCDYGAASEYWDLVAPLLVERFRSTWEAAKRVLQDALDAAGEEFADDIDRSENAREVVARHPDLAALDADLDRYYGDGWAP
ncbi:hypothetical protein GCM10023224_04800 [Streptomonospora halophila]|uniref:Uncharacterized protein n=1 Tax=Streptomonospora halophila TaxID=427369 RepID=A0ABP9G5K5_9ACTN